MNKNKKLKERILDEILRLSKLIYDDVPGGDCECGECRNALKRLFSFTINRLAMILEGSSTIDDFHDSMSDTPEHVREFYVKLLFVEK